MICAEPARGDGRATGALELRQRKKTPGLDPHSPVVTFPPLSLPIIHMSDATARILRPRLLPAAIAAVALALTAATPARADILYVTLANNRIEKITSAGTGSVFASTGLSTPRGLAFDSVGNLYAANAGGNTIEKFTPGGVGSVFASSGLSTPRGLAFDSAGNLYVANTGISTIEKFTPGGVGSVFASSGLSGPEGISFDSAGNLYAANTTNSTIEKFSSTGTDLGVFANSTNGVSSSPEFLAFTNDAGVPLPLANQTPEPASACLLGLGALLLASRRRRK